MDILIKNIGGLPEDGDLTLTITPKGQVILGGCIFTSNFGKEVKAIALPEHGDLIERDIAIDKMEYVSFDTAYNCDLAQEVLRYNVPVFLEASE